MWPTEAWKVAATAVGPGCGGRKLCIVDRAIDIGRPTHSRFAPVTLTSVNAMGTMMMNATS